MWVVKMLPEVEEWFESLEAEDAALLVAAIDVLESAGPQLGRPLVDTISATNLHKMKELRPGSSGRSEVRVLFCFDERRQAVLLVAGNKEGQWESGTENRFRLLKTDTSNGWRARTTERL